MDSESDKKKSMWSQNVRVHLTGEYCGGGLSGFAVGAMVMALVVDFRYINWVLIIGMIIILIGDFIAMHAQRRKLGDGL
jgi:hypothetical protein